MFSKFKTEQKYYYFVFFTL